MNQAVNPSPGIIPTLSLLVVVAALAGAVAFGIFRFASRIDVQDPEQEAASAVRSAASMGLGDPSHSTSQLESEPNVSSSVSGVEAAKLPELSQLGKSNSVFPSSVTPRQPTVVLPEFPVPLDPSEFETECEKFVEQLAMRLPDNPLALNVVAMYYSQMQQTVKADELWKRCVTLSPKDGLYYFNWATNFLNRSESERALEVIDQAVANGLDSSMFTYQRAMSLAALSKDEEVESLLNKEIQGGDKNPSLLLLLGQSQLKLGKITEAKASLESARAGGVYSKTLINGLLACAVRLKDKGSIESLRKELESFSGEQEEFGQKRFDRRSEVEMRRFGLGVIGESIEVLRRAGELSWAEAVGLRAIFFDPKNIDVYRLMVDVYRDKDEPQNAMVVYERICSLQPTDVLNYLLYARSAADAGHIEKAEAVLKYAIALAPLDPACYSSMGEFLLERNRPREAVWYFKQAIGLDPSNDGRLLYIRALKAAGEVGLAKEQEEILNVNREVPRVRATP